MRPRTKICGITSAGDRDTAVAAGADALGFVVDVTVDTPREITLDEAAALVGGVPPLATTVAVTMPDGPDEAIDVLDATGADALQVHGGLTPTDVTAVRQETGRRVIVAVTADDREAAVRYDGVADALLVDTASEDGGGGTGRTHDWTATRVLADAVEAPVIVAGGLAPGNVADAVAAVEPFGVDVASGVEARGGVKDHEAVRAFVARATARREAASR